MKSRTKNGVTNSLKHRAKSAREEENLVMKGRVWSNLSGG